MLNDLSRYRLNADSDLDEYRKDLHKFVHFQGEVYNLLDGLAIGDILLMYVMLLFQTVWMSLSR